MELLLQAADQLDRASSPRREPQIVNTLIVSGCFQGVALLPDGIVFPDEHTSEYDPRNKLLSLRSVGSCGHLECDVWKRQNMMTAQGLEITTKRVTSFFTLRLSSLVFTGHGKIGLNLEVLNRESASINLRGEMSLVFGVIPNYEGRLEITSNGKCNIDGLDRLVRRLELVTKGSSLIKNMRMSSGRVIARDDSTVRIKGTKKFIKTSTLDNGIIEIIEDATTEFHLSKKRRLFQDDIKFLGNLGSSEIGGSPPKAEKMATKRLRPSPGVMTNSIELSKQEKENEPPNTTVRLCKNCGKQKDSCFVPCGHSLFCSKCLMKKSFQYCPICNKLVESVNEVIFV